MDLEDLMDSGEIFDLCNNISNNMMEETPIKNTYSCKVCGTSDLLFDDHSEVCNRCGAVSYKIDRSHEFNASGVPRCGTIVNKFITGFNVGTNISKLFNRQLSMIQRWNAIAYKEKMLFLVHRTLSEKGIELGLTRKIIDSAQILYKKVYELKTAKGKQKIHRGINKQSIIAASLYNGAKIDKVFLNYHEVAKKFNISEGDLTKGNKLFVKALNQENENKHIVHQIQNTKPIEIIRCYRKELNLENDVLFRKIEKICMKLESIDLMNDHQDQSIAASCVIYLHGKTFKHDQICKIFDISIATLNKTYKQILKFDRLLTDDKVYEAFKKHYLNLKNQLCL